MAVVLFKLSMDIKKSERLTDNEAWERVKIEINHVEYPTVRAGRTFHIDGR